MRLYPNTVAFWSPSMCPLRWLLRYPLSWNFLLRQSHEWNGSISGEGKFEASKLVTLPLTDMRQSRFIFNFLGISFCLDVHLPGGSQSLENFWQNEISPYVEESLPNCGSPSCSLLSDSLFCSPNACFSQCCCQKSTSLSFKCQKQITQVLGRRRMERFLLCSAAVGEKISPTNLLYESDCFCPMLSQSERAVC